MTSTRKSEPRPPDQRPIVVGFDGSPSSTAALDQGVILAGALAAPLRLVTVWQYPTTWGYPVSGWSTQEDMQAMVRAAVAARFGHDVPPWFTAQQIEGAAAEVLIRESRDAQMLIVGSRGHGGFAGLLLGSVSSACAEHAACAVLVLHGALSPDHDETVSNFAGAPNAVHDTDDSRTQLALS